MTLPIQGYFAKLDIAGSDVTVYSDAVSYVQSLASLDKAVMDGTGDMYSISGLRSGAITSGGFVDTTGLGLLQAAFDTRSPVAFEIVVGDAAAGLDGGSYAGNMLITSFGVDTTPSGAWKYALTAETVGAVPYTPPA